MSAKIRTLIVDDEPLARERIRHLLHKESDIDVLGECADGRDAVASITKHKPDLVFLDVQMPELDGFGVLEQLDRRAMPAIVFVTAYDQFALRAFEVHALDYLLKPFDSGRFRKALGHAREHVSQRRKVEHAAQPSVRELAGTPRNRLMIKAGGRIHFVKMADVD